MIPIIMGYVARWSRGMVRSLALISVSAPLVLGAADATTSIDGSQAFRDFLATPPWIRKIQFTRDRNYIVDVTDMRHWVRKAGSAAYEGALQPEGFYLKHLAGSDIYDGPPGSAEPDQVPAGQETISGQSSENLWRLWAPHDELSLIVADNLPGGGSNNWLRGSVLMDRSEVQRACRLGLDKIGSGTLVWKDSRNFTGLSATGKETYAGTIRTHTNGRPQEVAYGRKDSKEQILVRYVYEGAQSFPPDQIIVQEKDGRELVIHTNRIVALEIGIDSEAPKGYSPEMFRAVKGPYKTLTLSSNGALFTETPTGLRQERTDYKPLTETSSARKPQHKNGVVAAIVTINAAGLLGAAWLFRKHIKRKVE